MAANYIQHGADNSIISHYVSKKAHYTLVRAFTKCCLIFNYMTQQRFVRYSPLKTPPHLKYVTTLPREI